ncbi:MAG: tryptophan-rich sensory protein [Beijerinckiaceae bacterium]|nr:tryptophan-rich sensory protein [Beijerinckiaceae bacterium]
MKKFFSLLFFVAIPVVAGGVIGAATAPGDWFATLAKPSFNPPSWVFAPVWTFLYALIGVAGWMVWRKAPFSAARGLWCVQMVLNWAWSPVFFTLHAINGAAMVIVLLLIMIIAFMIAARKVDVRASWFIAPYAAWVAFASALNIAIALLN